MQPKRLPIASYYVKCRSNTSDINPKHNSTQPQN